MFLTECKRTITTILFLSAHTIHAQTADPTVAKTIHSKKNPLEVVQTLRAGNARFSGGHATKPNQDAFAIARTSAEQHPHTVVVSCSDSRVPPEIIFDQGLGDMFSIRSAGHALGIFDLASVEYAVLKLGARVVLVLGHTDCGAVNVSLSEAHITRTVNLSELVSRISKGLGNLAEKDPNLLLAVRNNARSTLQYILSHSNELKRMYLNKEILFVEGLYDIRTGTVTLAELK